ncbi:MAG: glycine betaine/L-proline ABC transporter ATP-binding protein ProV [Alphaproteobacteria bacterium]
MTEKIIAKNLYKIFGDHPENAMALIREGMDKDAVFEATGHAVGVNDASFTIHEGEIFVVMGLSGSGKSTLVRLLNRLIEPTSGSILFDGVDIATMSDRQLIEMRRTKMSMVFQSFALMPHLNVIDNTAFGLELEGVEQSIRHERAIVALEQVGLAAYADNYPDELSGGMKQRVGLARALANDPQVLLMDEAFSALDPLIRTEMQDELVKLQAEHQRTVVFISHDLDEAMRIGDRIAIMEGGSVIQIGTPEELLNDPVNDYVRSFFRGVDISKVLTAGDIVQKLPTTLIDRAGAGVSTALNQLRRDGRDFGYVLGGDRKFHGVVSVQSLLDAKKSGVTGIVKAMLEDVQSVEASTRLSDLLAVVAKSPCAVPVVAENGRYIGAITRANLLESLARTDEDQTSDTNGEDINAEKVVESHA